MVTSADSPEKDSSVASFTLQNIGNEFTGKDTFLKTIKLTPFGHKVPKTR
jgi:hypothetical protein